MRIEREREKRNLYIYIFYKKFTSFILYTSFFFPFTFNIVIKNNLFFLYILYIVKKIHKNVTQ